VSVNLSGGKKRRQAISDINVTPLVDVMLVVLIIFMVTAPLMQQGIEIELPKTQSEGLTDEDPLVVTVKKDGAIFLQRSEVAMAELEPKLMAIFQSRGDREVFLRADERVAYGVVAQALAIMRRAGASQIGMVTEPDV